MDISVTLIVIWKFLAQKTRKLQSHLNFTEKKQDSEKKQSSRTFLNTNTLTPEKENRKEVGRKEEQRKEGQGKGGEGKEERTSSFPKV